MFISQQEPYNLKLKHPFNTTMFIPHPLNTTTTTPLLPYPFFSSGSVAVNDALSKKRNNSMRLTRSGGSMDYQMGSEVVQAGMQALNRQVSNFDSNPFNNNLLITTPFNDLPCSDRRLFNHPSFSNPPFKNPPLNDTPFHQLLFNYQHLSVQ